MIVDVRNIEDLSTISKPSFEYSFENIVMSSEFPRVKEGTML